MTLHEKAQKINTIIMDIDGVLTDGRLGYGKSDEIKFFHVRDGHGLKLAQRAGLRVGALSGRYADCNVRRSEELGFDFLFQSCKNKLDGVQQIMTQFNVLPENCLYIGDDLIDIPAMKVVGIAVAVADAVEELDEFADFRTERPGGHAAVREVIDWLLKEKNLWDSAIQLYLS